MGKLNEAFKRHAFFPRTKLDYWTFRKLRALKSRQVGAASWGAFLKYLTRDVNNEPTLHERVQIGTQKTLLQLWMKNFGDNLPNIRYGDEARILIPEGYRQLSLMDLVERTPILETDADFSITDSDNIGEIKHLKVKNPPKSSAVVIGRGPSLFQHKHLELLAGAKEKGYNGLIVASDGGLIPALEANVIPDVVVSVDGAPIIKKYFDHPLVKKHGSKIKWVASVTINHDVYLTGRAAGMNVYWFNPMFDDWRQNESWTRLQRLLSATTEFPRGIPALNPGGNSGACAWITAMELFKRSPVALIGLDMGYPEGTPLEETQYFDSMINEANGDVALLKKTYPSFYHPVFKTHAYVDLIFYHYRLALIEMQQETAMWYRLYGGTVNCTEGGTLFGPGITCMTFDDFLSTEVAK